MQRLFSTLLLCALATSLAPSQSPYYVDANAAPGGNGSFAAPFQTIQEATSLALDGETVLVAPGAYPPFTATRSIAIRSTAGPTQTTVGSVGAMGTTPAVGIAFAQQGGCVLDGFTLTGGLGFPAGGLILLDCQAYINNCIITNNTGGNSPFETGAAGGVSVQNSNVSLVGCRIFGNQGGPGRDRAPLALPGDGGPGGLGISSGAVVILRNSEVSDNIGGAGGFGGQLCAPTCSALVGGNGGVGGIEARHLSDAPTQLNIFQSRIVGNEGGIATLSQLMGPVARAGVGGLSIDGGCRVENVLIALNRAGIIGSPTAGGITIGEQGTSTGGPVFLRHITVANNSSQGVVVLGTPAGSSLANSIIWGNGGGLTLPSSSSLSVSFCDIQGTAVAGPGNVSQDPRFLAPQDGDFHLSEISPCIDAGTATAPGVENVDYDGHPRQVYAAPDIGADEVTIILRIVQNAPGLPIFVRNAKLTPGNEIYNFFSFDSCTGQVGSGPYLGLCANSPMALQSLVSQLLLPIGAEPVHFVASSTSTNFGAYPIPASTLDVVSYDATLGISSPVMRVVIQ